jgi:molybdate transport system ATP-binding protein
MTSEKVLQVQGNIRHKGFQFAVDCTLPMQGVTAIFGRSGCGKTTLLRLVAGLEKVNQAKVHFGTQVWQDKGVFVPLHQRRIGLVFQEHSLFSHLTVRDNMLYGYVRTPQVLRRFSLESISILLGLETMLDRRIDALSGGQRQRVAIGRALLTSPQLLLLDEPLSALDYRTKSEIMPFLEHLSQHLGVPILMVSHSVEEVERLANQIVFMDHGKIERIERLQQALSRVDSPLFRHEGASSILMAELANQDAGDGLSELVLAGCRSILWIPKISYQQGEQVRVRVLARDVALSLIAVIDSSLLNVLPAKIVQITMQDEARVLIKLLVGVQTLFAQVTQRSLRQLQLTEGMSVYALIKAVALVG